MSYITIASIIALTVVLIAAFAVIFTLQSRYSKKMDDKSRYYEAQKDDLQNEIARLLAENSAKDVSLKEKEAYVAKITSDFEERLREASLQKEKELKDAEAVRERERKEAALERERDRKEAALQREKDLAAMKDSFRVLSSENSDAFKAKSEKSIGELLKPVQEKFKEFSDSVKEAREKSVERHSRLEQQIKDLDERSRKVGDEARNLADALTGYSKVQGDFGEMLLTDVLKNAGLVEGVHFVTQHVITDESGHEIKSTDGKTLIPDVLVLYPDDTVVVIDSKVSLTSYVQWMNAERVEDRVKAAKAHAASVRHHVDELKAKDYASYIPEGKRKVDYNIMFIPVEGAFRLMIEEDPMLWQAAKDNNVLIVSQMTLVIVLNMIRMSWRRHDQEKNIAEVYKTAEELMSQLKSWMDNFVTVGDAIAKASKAYDESKRKLTDSSQSVIKKIEKLENLGLSPKRSRGAIKTGARMTGRESVIPKEFESKGEEI